ncbi:2-amino-4-hydroxy-6-hydroxymethyldihydropteridine diphosphokinase [Stakelama saccharophila]|uniref:2-amino-4-hydroxy-6-hydroxymethyldihydropteridine pyrophosphokinase n=1 Tax=Stakelama saccharophila TaxID=3075605 RepID=A0ABZ0BD09_9SPHN|nr:2-amino-4-hydroxy-6-hydroxymethyldihydropteridine diphosphokinase [Stakelama sp. W311]WNO54581.1 2-amino-4-hydroxy-6-hydroxymethyldihydropteridine diphosphokinase [Stakelama sp. W311]
MTTSFAIALGSNRRTRHGSPQATLRAAIARLGRVVAVSEIIGSAPVGPSARRFANAVAIIESVEAPPDLLARLKRLERAFERRPGRRWGARSLDCDIVLWSGGAWCGPGLTIPHPFFRERRFVLDPLAQVAPDWRDPVSGHTVRQLRARAKRG